MTKKLWIRLVGLLSLFAWGLTATLFGASTISPDATTTADVNILIFTSFGAAFLLTLLWAMLIIVERLDRPVAGHDAARLTPRSPVFPLSRNWR